MVTGRSSVTSGPSRREARSSAVVDRVIILTRGSRWRLEIQSASVLCTAASRVALEIITSQFLVRQRPLCGRPPGFLGRGANCVIMYRISAHHPVVDPFQPIVEPAQPFCSEIQAV